MRVIARLQEHGLGAADVADQDGVAARDRVLTLLAQRFLNTVRGNVRAFLEAFNICSSTLWQRKCEAHECQGQT